MNRFAAHPVSPMRGVWAAVRGLRSSALAPAAAVVLVTVFSALHNRGFRGCGGLAALACFALPLLAGASVRPWLQVSRQGWGAALVIAVATFGLPTLAVWAIVTLHLEALWMRPSAVDAFALLAPSLAGVMIFAAAEEFLFRGWLLQVRLAGARRAGWWAALVFAAAHVGATGSWWPAPIWLGGGLVLGWIVRRAGGSLWPAMLVHVAANLAADWFRLLLSLNLPFFNS